MCLECLLNSFLLLDGHNKDQKFFVLKQIVDRISGGKFVLQKFAENCTNSLPYFENNELIGVFKPVVENISEYMLQIYFFLWYRMIFYVFHPSFVFCEITFHSFHVSHFRCFNLFHVTHTKSGIFVCRICSTLSLSRCV